MEDLRSVRALVTGAGGFIGGHLCRALVEQGARVRAFVRYSSRGDRGTLDRLPPRIAGEIEVVAGDLRDVEVVRRAAEGQELVLHLGAQIAIPYSYDSPRDVTEVNVMGSLNVAQACLAAGVRRLVHVSTSEVYGGARTVPITEEHPLEPRSPYAASKVAADKVMETHRHAFGLPVTIVRPFNTYGPGQSARAVVPTIVTQALEGDTIRLGALHTRRDLTYVTDTVAGLIAGARAEAALGRTLQLGTGADVSVGELVEAVGRLLGRDLAVEHDPARLRPEASEVERLVSDPSLAAELTGWRPAVGLEEGLALTIEWIRANSGGYRVGEYAT